jgi:RecA/RadA recombinase
LNFKTGSKNLDKLLHGGFPGGALSTVMGEAGTGRTTIALATAASAVRRKQGVVFFDCEASITGNLTFNLGLTSDLFTTFNPTHLEDCLKTSLDVVSSGKVDLVLIDSPTCLQSNRGVVASVAGMFTNWMPKMVRALGEHPTTAVVVGWQLKRAMTRTERKTVNFGTPTALAHGTSVALVLQTHDEGIEVLVTKDRRDVVHADPPSCILRFTGRGLFEDIRVANEPINRSKIPTRFDREDPI